MEDMFLVGFLVSLGTVLLSAVSGYIVLLGIGYFGWIGLIVSTTILLFPTAAVLYRREKKSCLHSDDKIGWLRQKEALEKYLKEVKKQE